MLAEIEQIFLLEEVVDRLESVFPFCQPRILPWR